MQSFMKNFGEELWTGIAGLKNVDNAALGDDQTTIGSGATTIQENTEFGMDEEGWDDELFEDKDIISIEFDKRIEPRSEVERISMSRTRKNPCGQPSSLDTNLIGELTRGNQNEKCLILIALKNSFARR